MPGRVVSSRRLPHSIPVLRRARHACLAGAIVALATALGMRTSLAQPVAALPGGFLAGQHADSVQATAPPLFVARPDAAARQGSVSVGTAGKLIVTHQADLSRRVRSTLDGSMGFEAPGGLLRDGESGIRNGSIRWAVSGGGGTHGEVSVLGDPASRIVRGNLEAPLSGGSTLTAFGTSRWTNTAWGRERVHYGSVGLRTRIGSALFVQPDFHVVDIRSQCGVRLFGTHWGIGYRGLDISASQERKFGSQVSARKTWGVANNHLTLGAQVKQVPERADGRLLELGVGHAGLGGSLYWGTQQLAVLLQSGPVQVGFSQRPGLVQSVFGFKDWSLSLLQPENGPTQVGLGFVFGQFMRRVSCAAGAWQWQEPVPKAPGYEPHLRWPGFASMLY